jgi:hypothetical protein
MLVLSLLAFTSIVGVSILAGALGITSYHFPLSIAIVLQKILVPPLFQGPTSLHGWKLPQPRCCGF